MSLKANEIFISHARQFSHQFPASVPASLFTHQFLVSIENEINQSIAPNHGLLPSFSSFAPIIDEISIDSSKYVVFAYILFQ
jgi:hypothetical protein